MIRILLICLLSLLSSPGLLLAREVVFYHTDNVGTPVAMTNSTGAVVWRAHDKPFGEEFQTTATPHSSRRFIGKEKDKETGFVYIGARYLDPASGRFLQPDPVGPVDPMTGKVNVEMLTNPQRLNRYVYGLNNPYRYIDPDGRSPRRNNIGSNGRPVTNETRNSDLIARTSIRQQQKIDPNFRYESIGQENGGYLTRSDILRIQNAANRTNQEITVVGSRANGTASRTSDWDYIMSGNSRQRHSASSSVPRGTSGGAIDANGRETGIDVFQNYNSNSPNYSPLRPNEPHIKFSPQKNK